MTGLFVTEPTVGDDLDLLEPSTDRDRIVVLRVMSRETPLSS
jgi:hypothetical protein